MTDIVLEGRGVVDKYIGDAIMAFWGAPLPNNNHPVDAIRSSLRMVGALKLFNEQSRKEGDPEIDIGIGLNSGKVVAGNMGSDKRFDYTVMGDTVNLASRLESLTKTYGVHIIASEFTIDALGKERAEKEGIVIREIDRVKVKGKKSGVTIYEIADPEKHDSLKKALPVFNTARELYYKGDWDGCIKRLKEVENILPSDGPSKVFRERCEHFKIHPHEEWSGVYELTSK